MEVEEAAYEVTTTVAAAAATATATAGSYFMGSELPWAQDAMDILSEIGATASSLAAENLPESWMEHFSLIQRAMESTVVTAKLWVEVWAPLVMLIVWVVQLVFPFVLDILQVVGAYLYDIFLIYVYPRGKALAIDMWFGIKNTDPRVIAKIVGAFFCLLCIVMFVKWLRKKAFLSRFVTFISQKIKVINRQIVRGVNKINSSLFHLIIIVVALVWNKYSPEGFEYFNEKLFVPVAVALPLYFSLKALNKKDSTKDHIQWITYFMFVNLSVLYYFIPILPGILTKMFWWVAKFRVFFAFWMWFPKTRGCMHLYDLFVPVFEKFFARLPESKMNVGMIEWVLKYVQTVVPESYQWAVKDLHKISFLTLAAIPLFFFNWVLTMWGCIFFGILYPIYCTMINIRAYDLLRSEKRRQESENFVDIADKLIHNLEYWIVYSLFKGVHTSLQLYLDFVPFFFYDIELAFVIYLRVRGGSFFTHCLSICLRVAPRGSYPTNVQTQDITPTEPTTIKRTPSKESSSSTAITPTSSSSKVVRRTSSQKKVLPSKQQVAQFKD